MELIENTIKPAVSVVIPTFNHAEYLCVALKSVLDQTYDNYEIIIVNNNSTDHTVEMVESFKDQRIGLVNINNNGIIAASRNKGAELARSDIIAFLDSDDFWYPTKLKRCVEEFQNNYDVICHGVRWHKGDKPYKDLYCVSPERAAYMSFILHGNCVTTSASMVRKSTFEKVGGFCEDAEIVTSEDFDFWMRIARDGGKYQFLDEILGGYRIHKTNASSVGFSCLNAATVVLNRHFSGIKNPSMLLRLKFAKKKSLMFGTAVARKILRTLHIYWL